MNLKKTKHIYLYYHLGNAKGFMGTEMEYLFLIVNHSVTLTNMKKKSTPQVNNQGYAK